MRLYDYSLDKLKAVLPKNRNLARQEVGKSESRPREVGIKHIGCSVGYVPRFSIHFSGVLNISLSHVYGG